MNKLRRLRSLSPEMAETLRLAGVQGIFWAAMAVGNYQTVYLQSIGFPATDFGLLNAIACAAHSDGAILLNAIISNLDPDHQLFPRTDVAVCR